ncbi:hypothetical protein LIA77_01510 [Sarocladium implicatum]|nr:hypothetical protein LIA77_01510 [Sarocladium implicatum]
MTDSGVAAEHGRIAEYDWEPQRQHYGPQQSWSSYGQRGPPPMPSRPDFNRSTSSLPNRFSPAPYYEGYGGPRARTPGSISSGTPVSYLRPRRGSNDQSVRTSSLTSIVEMYQVPYNSPKSTQLRSMGSFYYDYTEGFENESPVAPTLPAPVCPVPQRSDSSVRPLVLSEDIEDVLDSSPIRGSNSTRASDQSVALRSSTCLPSCDSEDGRCECLVHTVQTSPDHGNVDHSANQHSFDGTNGDEVQTLQAEPTHKPVPVKAKPPAQKTTTPTLEDFCQSPQTPQVNLLRTTTPPNKIIVGHRPAQEFINIEYPSNTWGGEKSSSKPILDQRASTTSATRLRNSLDPALAEFASMYASFDRLARSPFSKAGDETYLSNPVQDKRTRRWPFSSRTPASSGHRKRHRRTAVATRAGMFDPEGAAEFTAITSGKVATVMSQQAPTPLQQFFTARHLRGKISASRLMKPLPPLPPEAYAGKNENARVYVSESSRSSVPRLRLRAKASRPALASAEPNSPESLEEGQATPPKNKTPTSKPRLKLKLSRAHLGLGSASKTATVVRSPALKQCNALSEFQHCTANDLFSPQLPVTDAFVPPDAIALPQVSEPAADKGEAPRVETLSRVSDQFDIRYPPVIPYEVVAPEVDPNTSQSHHYSYVIGSTGKEGHPLRQKISMLRLRIAGSHLGKRGKSVDTAPASDVKSASASSAHQDSGAVGQTMSTNQCHESGGAAHPSGRVKRWASNARHAVRLYVKKRLDRSPRVPPH